MRPMRGITGTWSLLLSPEERKERSKTGEADDSIALDSAWLSFLNPVLEIMKTDGPQDESLWGFDYPLYVKEFRGAARELRLELVPYQARHSGPSIDRSQNLRSHEETRKRGRWRHQKSMVRYEKAARLASTYCQLDAQMRALLELADLHLGAVILGQASPIMLLPAGA